jgi:hypothetical protein
VDAGAQLAGIAVWNYNVKSQGLYLDTNPIVYDPDDMFRKVSATFPVLREIAAEGSASQDDILLCAPVEYEYDIAGRDRWLYDAKIYDLEIISVLAKNDCKYTLVTGPEAVSKHARVLLALAPEPKYYSSKGMSAIRSFVEAGGRFAGHRELVREFFGDEAADAQVICWGDEELPDVRKFVSGAGEVYAVSGKIETTLNQQLDCHYARFWRECLGLERQSRAYVVAQGGRGLIYNISGRDVQINCLPSGRLKVYDRHGDRRSDVPADQASDVRLGLHEIVTSGIDFEPQTDCTQQ